LEGKSSLKMRSLNYALNPKKTMLRIHRFTFNPFSENSYLLINAQDACWVVDPGMWNATEETEFHNFIAEHGLKPQAILNTHAHIDHVLGVQSVADRYGIPFGLHALEAPVLAAAGASAVRFGLPGKVVVPPVSIDLKATSAYKLGEEDEIEIRHVPGHSPGSVIFYNAAGGWAIGGDALFEGSIGRTDLPGGDHQTLLSSIKTQMLSLPDDVVVHPGHGDATTIGAERKGNPFLRGV
jgi:glyoxylase-like metal-dependent hydrolase (beta-lactamase superfamily II)